MFATALNKLPSYPELPAADSDYLIHQRCNRTAQLSGALVASAEGRG
jgi:hypothetical protein